MLHYYVYTVTFGYSPNNGNGRRKNQVIVPLLPDIVPLHFHSRQMNLTAMRPFTEKLLCSPLDPGILYTPFFYGLLPGDNRIFSLRPFCIPVDMPVIYSWIDEYRMEPCKNRQLPIHQLLETYHDLLSADYSQSLMALSNGIPLMQIDIIRADLDEVSIREEVEPGDYSIHLLLSPRITETVSYFAQALNSCLYCFFSFPGVHRIYCKTSVNDRRSNSLLQAAGFVLDKTIREYRGKVNIYRHDQVPTLMG